MMRQTMATDAMHDDDPANGEDVKLKCEGLALLGKSLSGAIRIANSPKSAIDWEFCM